MQHAAWVGSILLTLTVGLSGLTSNTSAASSRIPTRDGSGLPRAVSPLPASFAGAHPAIASGADGTWHTVPIPPAPDLGARISHTMVFDTLHQRFVIFGGWAPGPMNEVWTHPIDGMAPWVREVVAGTPPAPRDGHTAVYDPTTHRMIVFGGDIAGIGESAFFANDLWQLDFSTTPPTWSPVATTGTPPPPRRGHTAVFDPVRRHMVVFGGSTTASFPGTLSNETWLLDCTTSPPSWQLASVAGPLPTARGHHSAIFDIAADRMVILGGYMSVFPFALTDVWTLSMGSLTWSQAPAAPDPDAPYYGAPAAYEPIGHRMFLTDPLWSLDLDTFVWTQWEYGSGSRSQAAFALDPSGHHGLLQGGNGPFNMLDDTWCLTVDGDPSWSPGNPIARRQLAAGIYDPVRDRFLMIGGQYGAYPLGDISELKIGRDSSWVSLLAETPMGRRSALGAIHDPVRDRVIVFGGNRGYGGNAGTTLNDVWIVQLSPSLAVLPAIVTGAPPSARDEFAAIYDPVRDRIVIDGGDSGGSPLGDVWALNLSPTMSWSQITPAPGPTPPARRHHDAIYDPYGDRMLTIVGGLWALSLGDAPAWTALAPLGTTPPIGGGCSIEFDPNRQRALLFGNISNYELWELKLGAQPLAWNRLLAGGPLPGRRANHLGIFDPIHDRMLVSGGVDHERKWADVWRLQFASDFPTATAIALLSSDAQSDEVVLKWGLSGDAATYARLERRDATSDWRTIESGTPSGSFVTFHDRSVVAGARHAYRLTVIGSGGASTSGEVWIDVPAGPVFSLAGFSPNPATQEARIAFSLSDRTPATIEVVDVGGRRVAARHIESPVPGRQTIAIMPAGGIAPGLYFVKLTQGSRTLVARGTVMR